MKNSQPNVVLQHEFTIIMYRKARKDEMAHEVRSNMGKALVLKGIGHKEVSQECTDILEKDGISGLHEALKKVLGRDFTDRFFSGLADAA